MSNNDICLLLGATGVGKTLLLKRLQNILLCQAYLKSRIYKNQTAKLGIFCAVC